MIKTGSEAKKDKRFEVQYNPQLFAILAEKLLTDAGVSVLYGTYAVGVKLQDNKVSHVITENKSGRMAYKVKAVVDAEIERMKRLAALGGFIPCPDHRLMPGTKFELVQYYAEEMKKINL